MIKINVNLLFMFVFIVCNLLQITYAQVESVNKPDWTKNTFKKDARVAELLQKVDDFILEKKVSFKRISDKENYSKVSDIENNELRKFLSSGYYMKADSLFNYENSYIVVNHVEYKKMQTDGNKLNNFSIYLLPKPSSCLDARYLQDVNKGIIFWPTHPPRYLQKGNTDEERALDFKKFVDFENNFNSRSILELDAKYGRIFLAANKKLCLIKIDVEIFEEPSK